jgi:hypothetical protein
MRTIFTIGHSTRPIAEFVALLRQAAIDLLVDVRSIPRSRTNPQFNAGALQEALIDTGITYRHLPALGGLRQRTRGAMPSPKYALAGRGPSVTMPITRQLTRFDWDWTNYERSPVTIAAPLCVLKLCGGAATAASSPTTYWRKGFRWRTSWGTIKSTPRSSRLACNRCRAGRSYTQPRPRRSKQQTDPALAHIDRTSFTPSLRRLDLRSFRV